MLKRKIHVFIVSDATGITAERVIKAALVQFIEIESIYEKFPYIQATDQIDTIFAKAEKHDEKGNVSICDDRFILAVNTLTET